MDEQNVGATAFYLPNSENPKPHAKPYYGNQNVPHPTNSAAKTVDAQKIMSQVNYGK